MVSSPSIFKSETIYSLDGFFSPNTYKQERVGGHLEFGI